MITIRLTTSEAMDLLSALTTYINPYNKEEKIQIEDHRLEVFKMILKQVKQQLNKP